MVVAPDRLPWREGMTIRDLLLLARGPTVGADLRTAQVSRLPDERGLGELADSLMVPLDSSYLSQRTADGRYVGPPGLEFAPAGSTPEFVLEPFDQLPRGEGPRARRVLDLLDPWLRVVLVAGVHHRQRGASVRPILDTRVALVVPGNVHERSKVLGDLTDPVQAVVRHVERAGATPLQAILAATKNAAALCGVGDELGTVETGKVADLIVVAENPLEDITNIRRLQLVVKDGKVVADFRD